jgi:hypothetical protein
MSAEVQVMSGEVQVQKKAKIDVRPPESMYFLVVYFFIFPLFLAPSLLSLLSRFLMLTLYCNINIFWQSIQDSVG